MNIDIIYSSKNYTIIRDNMTRYIWLYSYGKPIVYYNGILHFNSNNGNMTQLSSAFQYCIKNKEMIQYRRKERISWAQKCISGIAIARYFIDCLQGLNPSKPWANP